MRDKIAEALAKAHNVRSAGTGFKRDADAIVTALPGMIEPLVWKKGPYNTCAKSAGLCYSLQHTHGMYSVAIIGNRSKVFYRGASEDEAKAAANAHHAAQVMAAFGVVL